MSADAARSIAECKRDQDAPRLFSAGVVHRTKANQRFLYAIYNLEICIGWVAIARGFPAANEALIDEFRILPNFAHGSIERDALDFVEDEVADSSAKFERLGFAPSGRDHGRCAAAGMDDFLAKPLQVQELERCLGAHAAKALAEPA